MKSSNAPTTVYSKAASLLWLQGSKELPAAARVRGLNSAARAGLGNFQEKKPEDADEPRFFQKVGGGAYIYRLGERRWCIGPDLYGEEVIWAETSFACDRLPNSRDHSWRSSFGRPEVSITRCGCFIHQGIGLRAADLDDNSNPYVVCKVSGRHKLGFRTETRWKSLDPVWHEAQDLEGLELGETMYFKVMSQEEHKDDEFLGDAKLVVSPGGFNGGLVIMLRGRKAGTLRLELIVPPVFQDTSSAKKQPVVFDSSNPRDVVQAITWGTTEEAAHAVASLENILTSEGIRSRFVAAGIVQPLVSLLSDGSMDTQCKAAAALWNLGQCSVGKKILISSGGVQSLMQLFFEGTAYCKEESMAALLNIVSTEKVREELVAGGIVSWLMALLQSTSPKSLSHAIQLMGFLAEDQDVADNFMEASLTRLRQLLQDKNDDVRLQTAFAVSRIATADDRRQVLVEAEMVQPLNRLLKEGTYDCKAAAASAIGELANATDKRLFKKISMHLLEAEVLEPLLDLLGSHHDDCSSNASRALCILASTEKTGTAILERGALKPLVSLLKGKPQVSRILRVAKVLQALADFNRCGMDVALSQESSQQLMHHALNLLQEHRSKNLPTPRFLPAIGAGNDESFATVKMASPQVMIPRSKMKNARKIIQLGLDVSKIPTTLPPLHCV